VLLLAWICLAAAVASLYFGLSEEGRTLLYLSMAASALTVILALVQLRRGSPARARPRREPGGPQDAERPAAD
jgi:hypothetical protein